MLLLVVGLLLAIDSLIFVAGGFPAILTWHMGWALVVLLLFLDETTEPSLD